MNNDQSRALRTIRSNAAHIADTLRDVDDISCTDAKRLAQNITDLLHEYFPDSSSHPPIGRGEAKEMVHAIRTAAINDGFRVASLKYRVADTGVLSNVYAEAHKNDVVRFSSDSGSLTMREAIQRVANGYPVEERETA